MSAEIVLTPDERRTAAAAAIQARENAIRANAIKQGRELERQDQALERSRLTGEHAGQINGIKLAHLAELSQVGKHYERGAFWRGVTFGAAFAAMFVSAGYLLVVDRAMNQAFDRAQEIAAASTLVGAATQRRDGER